MQVKQSHPRIRASVIAGTAFLSAGLFCSVAAADNDTTSSSVAYSVSGQQTDASQSAPAPSSNPANAAPSSYTANTAPSSSTSSPKVVLTPRDALRIAPGETRLDGLPADTLDSTTGSFVIRVCSYAAGHNARVWLESPRKKPIIVDRKTLLYSFGSQSSQIVLTDVESRPFHVTVIGEDRGDGKALLARVVWIQRASPLETQFIKKSQGTKHTACGPDVRVSRPLVYTLGRNFPVCLVQAKLSTVRVRVGLAWRHVGATESLGGIVKDYGAIAGINGSFFDAYVHSSVKRPNNELICMSEPVFCSDIGTVLGFTPDGEARMARSPVADALHRIDPVYTASWPRSDLDQTLFWQRVTEGLGAGPRLVRDGQIELNPYSEGFRSAEVLQGVSVRSAVGITTGGWLMLVTTKASMAQLAHIMRALGCSQAMNLDGGSSSGLWARGHYLRVPGRQLSNALLILRR